MDPLQYVIARVCYTINRSIIKLDGTVNKPYEEAGDMQFNLSFFIDPLLLPSSDCPVSIRTLCFALTCSRCIYVSRF